jgi:hypothetical protein
MSNILYIDAVNGFEDAWMEMYDTHVVDVSKDWKAPENTVITRDEDELKQVFEEKYDCELTQQGKAHHYWYNFDSIEFNSESAHTMFLLKWS